MAVDETAERLRDLQTLNRATEVYLTQKPATRKTGAMNLMQRTKDALDIGAAVGIPAQLRRTSGHSRPLRGP